MCKNIDKYLIKAYNFIFIFTKQNIETYYFSNNFHVSSSGKLCIIYIEVTARFFCNIHFDNIILINIKRHRICCSPLFYVVYRFLPLWRSRSWVRTNWPAALRWISLYRFNACGHKRILRHITSIRLYTRVALKIKDQ